MPEWVCSTSQHPPFGDLRKRSRNDSARCTFRGVKRWHTAKDDHSRRHRRPSAARAVAQPRATGVNSRNGSGCRGTPCRRGCPAGRGRGARRFRSTRRSPGAGLPLAAFVSTRVDQHQLDAVVDALADIPEVVEVYGMTGLTDLSVKVLRPTPTISTDWPGRSSRFRRGAHQHGARDARTGRAAHGAAARARRARSWIANNRAGAARRLASSDGRRPGVRDSTEMTGMTNRSIRTADTECGTPEGSGAQ